MQTTSGLYKGSPENRVRIYNTSLWMKMMKMNKYKGIFSKIQLELVQSANIIDPKMVMFVCPMLHCGRLVGFSWTFHCRVTSRCCAVELELLG